jgi:diketogulonate reductase-like aldo/keto reductase
VAANAEVYDFEIEESDMERLNALDEGDSGAVSWNPTKAS